MNPNTLRIISIVQARVDAFLKDLFDIYKSTEDDLTMKTSSDATATKKAICDAVEVVVRHRRNECSLFSRLDVDVVHSIFGAALDLDLVHDPFYPLESLDQHRHQLFRMRRVSTSWNKFLLSSPRYWRVIDIKSPPGVISAAIERSGSSPLCICCIKARLLRMDPHQLASEEMRSCISRMQTLRSDDPDAYLFCRSLLGTRTPTLRTLKLMGGIGSPDNFVEPLGDLSPIRHLTACWWQPPSDAVWLMGLRELTLVHLSRLNTETFLVLSACASLETLNVQCDHQGIVDNLSDAPSPITLPHLQTMNLNFKFDEPAVDLIRRLFIPQCLRANFEIAMLTLPLDQPVVDYCKFMSPGGKCTQYPSSANILINTPYPDHLSLTYETESRRIAFEEFDTEEMPALHNLIQKFQTLLKEPSLNVTFIRPSAVHRPILQSLGSQNIRAFAARRCNKESVDTILSVIGESKADALVDGQSNAITWPFESLKSLTISSADLNVSQITRLVGIRQQYLQENSKTWLEEIVLVNCRLKGMRLAKAVKQLAALGVALRGVACSRM